jgi:hypothetical protein
MSLRRFAAADWRALSQPAGVVGTILLFVFLLVLVVGRSYPSDAALFPSLVGSAGLVLGLIFLGSLVFDPLASHKHTADAEHSLGDRRSFWIALLASPVYSFSVFVIGFHVASFLAMVVMPLLLGFRHVLWLVLIALAMVIVLHLVFAMAMEIDMPMGLIGDFILRRFVYED